MYAIVEIAGKQFKVENGANLLAPRILGDEGAKIDFDRVLLVSGKGGVKVGTPTVEGATVTAKIVQHGRDRKVIVFKKKRRKGYRVKRGHRQDHTEVKIEKIVLA